MVALEGRQRPGVADHLLRRRVEFDPTSKENVCDRCGSELFQRDDDKAETIANRLVEYNEKTAPLVDFYGAQGKLVGIDATGPVEDVTVRAIDALRSYGG